AQERSGRVTGRVAGEVQDGAHDLVGLADALQVRTLGRAPHGRVVPVLHDVGAEGTGDDAVDPHGRPEGVGQPDGHRVEAGLRGRVRDDAAVWPQRADAAEADDRATALLDHARAD